MLSSQFINNLAFAHPLTASSETLTSPFTLSTAFRTASSKSSRNNVPPIINPISKTLITSLYSPFA
ncbi:hypothetical protein Hanom_Chr02g00172691 [Helianthus anomalus]